MRTSDAITSDPESSSENKWVYTRAALTDGDVPWDTNNKMTDETWKHEKGEREECLPIQVVLSERDVGAETKTTLNNSTTLGENRRLPLFYVFLLLGFQNREIPNPKIS